jgi:hypothetical protein
MFFPRGTLERREPWYDPGRPKDIDESFSYSRGGVYLMEGKKIGLIAGGLLVALVAGFFAYRAMPQGEVTQGATSKSPDDAFYREMAKKCQGDFAKLPPADQQLVLSKNNNNAGYAATYMTRYWAAIQKGQ